MINRKFKLAMVASTLLLGACASMPEYQREQRVDAHRAMEHYLVGDYAEARAGLEHTLSRTRVERYFIKSDPQSRVFVDPVERNTWVATLAAVYFETGEMHKLRLLVEDEMEGHIQERWRCRIEEHVGNLSEAAGCYAKLDDGIGQARVFRRSAVDATLSAH